MVLSTPFVGHQEDLEAMGCRCIETAVDRRGINPATDLKLFSVYRRLIRLRKEYPVFTDGKFKLLLPEDERIFAYTRTDEEAELLVCANFTGETASCTLPAKWQDSEILLHNYEGVLQKELRPYEAVILLRKTAQGKGLC